MQRSKKNLLVRTIDLIKGKREREREREKQRERVSCVTVRFENMIYWNKWIERT